MKYTILLTFVFIYFISISQSTYSDSIVFARIDKQIALADTAKHVLNAKDLEHFQALDYFPIDTHLIVEAKWELNKGKKFKMPTSTTREPIYRRYGYLHFTLNNQQYTLTVYQNMELKKKKAYQNYFFVPFRDQTSGSSTYGGGRYMDLYIFKNQNAVTIDFNSCYNPYCAYSHRYSCPIPPKENILTIPIEAGEKTPLYDE